MSTNFLQLAIDNLYGWDNLEIMTKLSPEPPPGQHPLVEEIRLKLAGEINYLNDRGRKGRLGIKQIANMCGMSYQFIASFKTHKRCVQDFPLDTFFKLTDGLKMDRGKMVQGVQDILTPKIEKSLNGPHRGLFQKFIECLEEAESNQIEILENLVSTIHRQSDEIDPPKKQKG